MPNLVLVPQSEVLTPIFQVSCPTIMANRSLSSSLLLDERRAKRMMQTLSSIIIEV